MTLRSTGLRCVSRLLVALAASVLPLQGSATFVDGGTYVQDTSTGLDWLKLNYLNGYSYQNVAGGALGYTTSGWRFAKQADLLDLFIRNVGMQNDAYTNAGPVNALAADYLSNAEAVVVLFGMNLAFNDARATYNIGVYPTLHQISSQGFIDDENPENINYGYAELTAVIDPGDAGVPGPLGRWVVTADVFPPTQFGPYMSSFLTRDSAPSVPEPGTLVLLTLGLAGLGLIRRKLDR